MKVYIEMNNIPVELIRLVQNIDFIDVRNLQVGNFRNRRVYKIGLIAIRDVSQLFCAVGRKVWGRGNGFRLFAFPANRECRLLWNSTVVGETTHAFYNCDLHGM